VFKIIVMGVIQAEFSDISAGNAPPSACSNTANISPPVEIYKCGKAFQPLLTPKWITGTFMGAGVLFVALGISLIGWADDTVEHHVYYDGPETDDSDVSDHGVNWFLVNVDQDMEAPIYMYYELTGFAQNHRRFRESRADKQMAGQEPVKYSSDELDDCHPLIATHGRVNYPCGLVAGTIFNDSYVVRVKEPNAGNSFHLVELDQSSEAIVWRSDIVKKKFQQIDPEENADGGGTHQTRLNIWITKMFPPVACEQVNFSVPVIPVDVATRKELDPKSGAEINVTDCWGYKSAEPKCNFVQGGKPFVCNHTHRIVQRPHWGIESPHFAVWMRAAGLDKTRKLWAVIHQSIMAGSVINVTFVHRFPVKEFHGRKAVFFTTASWMGGSSPSLFIAISYLVLGSLCVLYGSFFLVWHWRNPRRLGDVNCVNWIPKMPTDDDVLDSMAG